MKTSSPWGTDEGGSWNVLRVLLRRCADETESTDSVPSTDLTLVDEDAKVLVEAELKNSIR